MFISINFTMIIAKYKKGKYTRRQTIAAAKASNKGNASVQGANCFMVLNLIDTEDGASFQDQ